MKEFYNLRTLSGALSGTYRIVIGSSKRKSTFFKVMKDKGSKKIFIEECSGYLYKLKDFKGYEFLVSLWWDGFSWYATHFTTGLNFTPIKKVGGSYTYRGWNKEDLINTLKELDLERLEKNHLTLIDRVETIEVSEDLRKRIFEVFQNEET